MIDETIKKAEDKIEHTVNDDHKADDSLGKHNVFSRIMIVAVIGVFIYAFTAPLAIGYATTISWLFFAVFAAITFGINSLKIISEMISKIKGR